MLLSAHIPKTAGVSFRNILSSFYGPGFIQHYWQITDATGRVLSEIPASARCVHGHFVASDLAAQFPQAAVVTWVRDPVERVASSYYYRLRQPDWQHPVCVQLHAEKLGLLEYAELGLVRNEMARFMGELQPGDFDFIGLAERFDESLSRFCSQFDLPALASRRDNCNPGRGRATYDLSPVVRDGILRLNETDAEIYRECLARFESASGQKRREA